MSDDAPPAPDEIQLVEIVPDELALARAQLGSGLAAVAEGTLRRQIARLEAAGRDADDELEAARAAHRRVAVVEGTPRGLGRGVFFFKLPA